MSENLIPYVPFIPPQMYPIFGQQQILQNPMIYNYPQNINTMPVNAFQFKQISHKNIKSSNLRKINEEIEEKLFYLNSLNKKAKEIILNNKH